MSVAAHESLKSMLREFDAQLQKGDNPGAWTCVLMDDVSESSVPAGSWGSMARSTASRSPER
jgi:hypothetical protein